MSLPPEHVRDDYPRPAICEPIDYLVTVEFAGQEIVRSQGGYRALETYHPPSYYLPMSAVMEGVLRPNGHRSLCEWKGQASYFDIVLGDKVVEAGAWTYTNPTPSFAAIRNHVAIYAEPMDRCTVAGVEVLPQAGNFYGGWVTPNLSGPIKGAPGTTSW
ncbi:MAG: DUF427 domain-containing protein [Pseudomonadota bacterium]